MNTLYHYCSTSAFHSIVLNRSLWLSSLKQSNDYMEGKAITASVRRAAERDNIEDPVLKWLTDALLSLEQEINGFGLCLSEEGDMLSQWRGYADDASGVAIGFSLDYLTELTKIRPNASFGNEVLHKVAYTQDEHDAYIENEYKRIICLAREEAAKAHDFNSLSGANSAQNSSSELQDSSDPTSLIFFNLFVLGQSMFFLKDSGFAEEREWRIVSSKFSSSLCHNKYRDSFDRLIPYRELALCSLELPAIFDVVLGPKHMTPPEVIADFLSQNGFNNVKVRNSNVTYR